MVNYFQERRDNLFKVYNYLDLMISQNKMSYNNKKEIYEYINENEEIRILIEKYHINYNSISRYLTHKYKKKEIQENVKYVKPTFNISDFIKSDYKMMYRNPFYEDTSKMILFAFDLDNFAYQYKKKYPQLRLNVVDELITKIITPITTDQVLYQCFWFVSEHYHQFKKENLFHKWFEESNKKMINKTLVTRATDLIMIAIITEYLTLYHKKIAKIYIGSGDGDFAILCDLIKKYKIPIEIIAFSQEITAVDIFAKYTDKITYLYKNEKKENK